MANIDIRTIDGTENQPNDLGKAEDELTRLFEPAYEDDINEPRGGFDSTLPNPRKISNIIADQDADAPTGNPLRASDWLWQWGQFIDHDLSLNEGTDPSEIRGEELNTGANFFIPVEDPEDPLFGNPEFSDRTELPFTRVPAAEGTGEGEEPRQQENELTSFIDGSQGYGSALERAAAKRTDLGNSFYGQSTLNETPPRGTTPFDGKLLVANDEYNTNGDENPGGDPFNESGEILLPYNRARPISPNADPVGIGETGFISGDVRSNEQLGLISVHTLFVREHNVIVDKIASHLDAEEEPITELYEQYRDEFVPSLNLSDEPTEEQVRGEFLYEAARAVVGAKTQVITYKEFLPLLIGKDDPDSLETIDSSLTDPSDPRISNEFANAAFRVGHTLLNDRLRTVNPNGLGEITLQKAFFDPDFISQNGVDQHLIGLSYQEANDIDNMIVDGVREFLFGAGTGGFDLAAINIQRGRDVGLPSYVEVYETLFPDEAPIENFEDLDRVFGAEVADLFGEAYDSVDQIDLWIGGISEIAGDNEGLLGPTFSAIIEDQFARLRNNDRFFYLDQLEDSESFLSIIGETINLDLKELRLSDVIRNHVVNPELVPDDVFIVPFDNEVFGTEDADELSGTAGNDLIDGDAGNDTIEGDEGDDILFGQAGNDTINGGEGNDSLFGGAGSDVLEGNLGDDLYLFELETAAGDTVSDTGGSDTIIITPEDLNVDDPANPSAANTTISIAPPSEEAVGIEKVGTDLIIDINSDGVAESESDLTISNFFSDGNTIEAGTGFVENINDLSGTEILESYSSLNLTGGTAQIAFVAYYGRPADGGGLEFWNDVLAENEVDYAPREGDTLTGGEADVYNQIVDAFGNAPEADRLFGGFDSDRERVNQVYQFAFGRDGDEAGLDFWTDQIDQGNVTLATFALEVALGAQNNDIVVLNNKIDSADLFTNSIDTPAEVGAYQGSEAEIFGRDWLSNYGLTTSTQTEVDSALDELVG